MKAIFSSRFRDDLPINGFDWLGQKVLPVVWISADQRQLAVRQFQSSENLICVRGDSRRVPSNVMLGIHVRPGERWQNQDFAREVVSVGTHDDAPDDRAYWLGRSAEERIAGVEFLCRQFYSYASAEPELRRFVEVVDLPTSGDCAPL